MVHRNEVKMFETCSEITLIRLLVLLDDEF